MEGSADFPPILIERNALPAILPLSWKCGPRSQQVGRNTADGSLIS